jgi:hypothetical protein
VEINGDRIGTGLSKWVATSGAAVRTLKEMLFSVRRAARNLLVTQTAGQKAKSKA